MIIRIVSMVILAIFCVVSASAHAAPRCADPGGWGCFGTIEVGTESTHCKCSTFRNGDRLLEARVTRRGKSSFFQRLAVEPSFRELYEGDNGLYMMAYGMVHVVTDALRAAYPDGVNSVPEGSSVIDAKIYNTQQMEIPLVLSTRRSHDQIEYSIKFGDDTDIKGVWDSRYPEPLPDSYDVRHWRHRMPHDIKTLKDVRVLK